MSLDWRSWFLPGRPPRKGPAESLAEPAEEDLAKLEELREAGSKLKLPHPLRNFILLPAEKEARQCAQALGEDGYSCQVRALQDGRWLVTAVIRVVPRPGVITAMRERLQTVAATLEGEYAGWESPLVY